MKNNYFGRDLHAMRFAVNYHQWIRDEFEPFLGHDIAEVGAGNGNFSRLLLETDHRHLTAFEPSDNMFADLDSKLGHDPRCTLRRSVFQPPEHGKRFDSILYVNVLEHIEDDLDELKKVHSALRPEGHLLVFVPAHHRLYSRFDRQLGHYRRYNKITLKNRVRDAGFRVLKTRYFDFPGALIWFVKFRLLNGELGSDSVRLYDRLAVPAIRVLETRLHPPAGKNLLLIAKKTA